MIVAKVMNGSGEGGGGELEFLLQDAGNCPSQADYAVFISAYVGDLIYICLISFKKSMSRQLRNDCSYIVDYCKSYPYSNSVNCLSLSLPSNSHNPQEGPIYERVVSQRMLFISTNKSI